MLSTYCGAYKKIHPIQLSLSEVMTILVYYHLSPYKTLKLITPAMCVRISTAIFQTWLATTAL